MIEALAFIVGVVIGVGMLLGSSFVFFLGVGGWLGGVIYYGHKRWKKLKEELGE